MTLRNIFPLFVLLVVFVAASCTQKKQEQGDGEHHVASADDWKEMDDFHMVMAESFHPYKDSANLDPAIKNSPSLVAAAEHWANAPLPERVDNDETKGRLKQLKEAAVAFEGVANSGDPDLIGESLTALHDKFHELQETWYGAAAGHDEHH